MKYHIGFDLEFKRHNYSGKFIVFEGVDASGKTTHAKELVEKFKKEGIRAVYTKEPTDGEIGELIRKVLKRETKLSPIALQYLFCADRAIHQGEIIRLLKHGFTVVSDRYFWSAVAYGLSDIAVPVDRQGSAEDFYLVAFSVFSFYHQFILPDVTFFLDVNVDEAAARIRKSPKHRDIYDTRAKIVKIKGAYEKLIERFRKEFTIINANRPIGEVSKELLNYL